MQKSPGKLRLIALGPGLQRPRTDGRALAPGAYAIWGRPLRDRAHAVHGREVDALPRKGRIAHTPARGQSAGRDEHGRRSRPLDSLAEEREGWRRAEEGGQSWRPTATRKHQGRRQTARGTGPSSLRRIHLLGVEVAKADVLPAAEPPQERGGVAMRRLALVALALGAVLLPSASSATGREKVNLQ